MEIECLTGVFCEGGHGGKTLRKIINDFEKKTRTTINTTNDNNTNKKQTVTVPWVPKIGPGVRGEIQKFVCGVAFKRGTDLDRILCKNRDKLVPGSYSRVYELGCSYGSVYSGGAAGERVITRSMGHQRQSIGGSWTFSGATEHMGECDGCFDWLRSKTLSVKNGCYDRKVRESFEVGMAVVGYGREGVLGRDNGSFVGTSVWKALFRKMKMLH